ncbi:uncharacterized protein LOC132563603 [Ylistrum balloti]|uniref:uncharacterized protein LOC132563603 n=1 Tax=Ylistrum balloti TaxID=509963 RepID=UPI002905F40D|nr:uncharacterized protein LOC132563603 [Ylistrum balloti]
MGRDSVVTRTIDSDQPIGFEIPSDLPNPALYAVLLEVKDIANNVKQARRFVMFDNTSKILVRDDKPLYSTTATDITNNKWQTNHGDLCYSWADRYYNDKSYHLNLLQPIKPDYHGHITGIYEQISGILPVSGTANVHGITHFYFSLSSETEIISKENVPDFASQKICLSPTMQDGEIYRFEIEAQDIMHHTYTEHVYTHIDSSGPEIFDVGLEKDGYKLLSVHNSSDLSKMILKFNALDIHSGLYSVDWSLGTSFEASDIGNGSLGVVRFTHNESCVERPNCYCPSIGQCAYFNFTLKLNSLVHLNTHNGNHNRVYHFTLTVTNEARLHYVEHIEVLTDDSPPAVGMVREGPVGGPDIDYTSRDEIIVHWDGFIDHESGVQAYRVGLARTCLGREAIDHKNGTGVLEDDNEISIFETTYKSALLILPEKGQYFVTVVAYNNAREPSDPMCSDGVVLDKTPPVIVNVTMRGASVTGAVVCSDETAWYITKNLTRYRVNADCADLCRNTPVNEFASLLPVETSRETNQPCQIGVGHGIIYLPHDLIYLQWDIKDTSSQVHDVYIGIGSTKESGASPDLIDFHKSPHIYSYKQRHVGLSNGEEIFIFLKIINSAGLTTLSTFGPVIIDETPPICPSSLPVSIYNNSLDIYWDEGTFYDNEQKEPITKFVFRVSRQGIFVSGFRPMDVPNNISCFKKHKTCLTITLSDLQVYDGDLQSTFIIQLHAFNNAGHHCTVNTDIFVLPSQHSPGHGVVRDVVPTDNTELNQEQDIDVLILPDEYCVTWEGFEYHGDIKFELGLGLLPGTDDITPLHGIPDVKFYCEDAKTLHHYRRYFVTIRGITPGGFVEATSDGFTIINSSDVTASLKVYDGYDCARSQRTSLKLKVGTANIYTSDQITFHVGYSYTLETNASIKIESDDVIIKTHKEVDMFHYYEFVALSPRSHFTVTSELNVSLGLNILNCVLDVDRQTSSDAVSLYWSKGVFSQYVSHYEVGLQLLSHGASPKETSDSLILAFTKVPGKSATFTFDNTKLVKGHYSCLLRPCIEYQCLGTVTTNGFDIMDPVYDSFSVISTLNKTARDCSDIHLKVTDVQCQTSHVTFGFRWAIFRDTEAKIQLTKWDLHIVKTHNINFTLSKCLKLPLYPKLEMFTCVEVYCPAGSTGVSCVPLIVAEDPNIFDKTILYEVDSDADEVRNNKDLFYSNNIGDKMAWLHGAELDFTDRSVRPGGVIIGMGDLSIMWYLLKDSKNLNQTCEENPNCVASVQTLGGFSVFQGINLEPDIMYFICATTQTNGDGMSSLKTCGNGFVVDVSPPSTGDVTVMSEKGFLINVDSVIVHWDRFRDFHGYKTTLGYPSTIAKFSYFIGSEPYGQDVVAETDIGLHQSVKVNNPPFRPGTIYYATVKAFDRVGHTTSSVSNGVVFDNTAPVIGTIQVGTFLRPTNVISSELCVHLVGLHDNESGIYETQFGLGSTEHAPDVVDYQQFVGETACLSNLTSLYDGHKYYAIILVTNRAGLSAVSVSDKFIVDKSAPTRGVVRDGISSTDIDFQSNTTHGGCHWSGFHDHHSGIKYYSAGLGTIPQENDVRPLSFTGTNTEIRWTHNFIPGATYYCMVQACNGAGLCTSVSSNGFKTDNSPPLPGVVHVGFEGHHSRFWAHAHSFQVEWFGFVDVESGIKNYDICVRHASISECDILSLTNMFLTNSLTYPVPLPQKVPLSVEIRAYNYLNMSVISVSDSFIVDSTPPVLVAPPVLGTENKGLNVSVQFDPSLLTLKWKFVDEESPIVRQVVSVRTHHDGHSPVEDVYLSTETSLIITLDPPNWLVPGDIYIAIVTACNEAALCTRSTSNELLVDPTPPHLGGFLEPLSWHTPADSNLTGPFINMTVHGFKDIESGIKTYYVTVGDSYSGSEISEGVLTFPPSEVHSESESFQFVLTEYLQSGRRLVLSVWAENHAGLFSDIGRVTVTVIASDIKGTFGYLEILKHSCGAEYCNKDCTCAVVSQKCHTVNIDLDCTEHNQTHDDDLRIQILPGGKVKGQALTASSACISANWTVTEAQRHNIKRTEWSMGQLGMPVGTGVFDLLLEKVWYDIGQRTSVTHCLLGAKSLQHDTKYVVYVRAWTSTSDFIVFTSPSILTDNTPPSVKKGKYIVENSNGICSHDADFTIALDRLTACWSDVFTDAQSGIYTYRVALGTIPGGDDVIPIYDVGLNNTMSWNDLSLSPGTKYYVSVTCINHLGIKNMLVSDGILVDKERPYKAIVFNTERFHNAHVQNAQDVGVSFYGFEDRHSAINNYSVGLQISDTVVMPNSSPEFHDTGLRTKVTFHKTPLRSGQWFRFAVKARDFAGFESDLVYSTPAMFDSTAPFHINITMVTMTETVTSSNGTLYWFKIFGQIQEPTVYKLQISSVNITAANVFEISFENQKQIQPVMIGKDGVNTLALSFISSPFHEGNRSLSVFARGLPKHTILDFTLSISDDVTVTGLTDNVVEVYQVSATELQINVDVMDKESGIKDIYVGVGSTRGGFQFHPLIHVLSSYNILLPVDVPHRQTLHVTVIAVNQAGSRNHFHSSPVIMDHTPPIISNATMTTTYREFGNQTLSKVRAAWDVIDEESPFTVCLCEIIENGMSHVMYLGKDENECETSEILIENDTYFSTRIQCTNSANLYQVTSVDPKHVILRRPEITNARITFHTTSETSAGLPVVRSSSMLTFSWDIYADPFDIDDYSYRICRGNQHITEWETTDLRNYAAIDHVTLKDNDIYTVEVRTCFNDGMFCAVINGSFLISGEPPILTGLHPRTARRDSGLILVWDDVFKIRPELLPRYTVTAGTGMGLADLLRQVKTTERHVVFSYFSGSDVYIHITCTYVTGPLTTYRGKVNVTF